MTQKFTIFLTVLLLSFSAYGKEFNTNKTVGFRVSDYADTTRFVLDLTQKPKYKATIWLNPDRLVIEIPNTTWGDITETLKETTHIKNIRHNALSNNTLQIVLDLKSQLKIKKRFILPPKNDIHRLVVDLVPSTVISEDNIVDDALTIRQGEETPPDFIPTPKFKRISKTIIAIDAGHGGHDPGTTGYHGTLEKKVTLSYAYAIKKTLEDTGRYEVVLTRKNDTYIDLKKRVEISRQAKAAMFISIHADSHNNRMMNGLSIYTLSEKASDKEAEALAQKENNAGLLPEVDVTGDTKEVTELLIDLVQRETKNLSAEFAENILREVKTETELLHNKPHRFAGFRVLTAPDIPSVLVELGYLSNRKEESILLSKPHKTKIAEAIVQAVDKHFKKYPVE